VKPIGEMTQAEVGARVQTLLEGKGIDVVLSGGGAVALFTSGMYVSHDIDLVNRYSVSGSAIPETMAELGFKKEGRHFVHPDTEFYVEFPPGPLTIGEQPICEIEKLETEAGILRVISPTDCVKDRLAWYYHNSDHQCLDQAILVSKSQSIDLDEIGRWSEGEGKLNEFEEIRSRFG
jgi:hypothetical protein